MSGAAGARRGGRKTVGRPSGADGSAPSPGRQAGGALLWRIAWRNLWRNRTRTWILTSVIAFTFGFSLLGMGIGDDTHARMLEDAVKAAGGDVLVHGEGYWDSRSSDIVIEDADAVLATVRGVPGVARVLPRVLVNGLLSTSAASRPVFLQGVRPELEQDWRDLASDVTEGTFLTEDVRDPLVVGDGLAEKLEVVVGDRVVLTASEPSGEVTRALFHVTGVLHTGTKEMDESLAFTTVGAAQRAVSMEGRLTQIGVLVSPDADAAEVTAGIRRATAAEDGLEVLTWQDAVPEMVGFVKIDDSFGYIYLVVIFVVVLFSITNTFLMAVMERVRELGLLSALGLRGRGIGRLLMAEALLLTGLAMAVGLALGLAGHVAVGHWGLNLASWGVDEIEVSGIDMADMVIHSRINPAKWIGAAVLVALSSLLSALYPAWKATRLAPAEAMRFYE